MPEALASCMCTCCARTLTGDVYAHCIQLSTIARHAIHALRLHICMYIYVVHMIVDNMGMCDAEGAEVIYNSTHRMLLG